MLPILVIFEDKEFFFDVFVFLKTKTVLISSFGCIALFNLIFPFNIFFRLADSSITVSALSHEVLLLNAKNYTIALHL